MGGHGVRLRHTLTDVGETIRPRDGLHTAADLTERAAAV